jgi:hypothetical protein
MNRLLVSGLVLVAASLALGTHALAGGFNTPFNGGACNDPMNPWDSLDAVTTFVGNMKCVDLCKATEKDCEKYTKDAASCQNNLISDNEDYSKKECENLTGDARKACRQSAIAIASESRDILKTNRDSALGLCQEWGAGCQAACAAPVL